MSIGEVLTHLRSDFPDVTISKIRFLESEGLIEPQRTASGYRKFSSDDVLRLRYVLAAQRDHYLPLRVIKEHLEALDRGLEVPSLPAPGPRVPRVVAHEDGFPSPEAFAVDGSALRLSRDEVLEAAGIDDRLFDQVESYGLVPPPMDGSFYDGDALAIARTVAALSAFGIEPRHLRPFKASADREVGLVEQVVTPMLRQRNADGRARAQEAAREIAALSVKLHTLLVKTGLKPNLRG